MPDGAKMIGRVLVKTGLLLYSQDASLGMWKGLILLSIGPAQHSYLVVSLLDFGVSSYQKHVVPIPDIVEILFT